ncbi:hypothetical protein ACTFIU_006598 [Dictyostelium citrinum]
MVAEKCFIGNNDNKHYVIVLNYRKPVSSFPNLETEEVKWDVNQVREIEMGTTFCHIKCTSGYDDFLRKKFSDFIHKQMALGTQIKCGNCGLIFLNRKSEQCLSVDGLYKERKTLKLEVQNYNANNFKKRINELTELIQEEKCNDGERHVGAHITLHDGAGLKTYLMSCCKNCNKEAEHCGSPTETCDIVPQDLVDSVIQDGVGVVYIYPLNTQVWDYKKKK